MALPNFGQMYSDMANSSPQMQRGQVWCRTCGATQKVDSADCLRNGWPKCCGYKMRLDGPAPPSPMSDR